MILTVGVGLTGFRFEVIGEQTRLLDQLIAITHAFLLRQIVIEQVVRPAHPVKKMAGGEIDIRFVAGIAPNVVAHRRVHVFARRIQIFLVALYFVDERSFGNCNRHIVLLPASFGGWRRRISSERPHVTQFTLP